MRVLSHLLPKSPLSHPHELPLHTCGRLATCHPPDTSPPDQSDISILSVAPATCDARTRRRHLSPCRLRQRFSVFKQCDITSAALILRAASSILTLQACSSSRRVASTLSSLSPFHASACRPSLRQAAARQYFQFGIMPAVLGSPSLSGGEHSRAADPALSLSPHWLKLRLPSPAPSTSHRTLLLCCPCRADPTQPSNTFHMTACSRILPIHTAGRQRDPEPSHQRACRSFYTDALPF
jgi:hypothetical protein